MKLAVLKGATSQILYVFIRDSSATTGVGLTGLAFNTGSLVASYVRPAAARSAITLATQTTTGAFSSGGFVEVDATNMPGIYRLDIPDAVFATGVDSAVVMLNGAANMEPVVIEFQLTGVNLQDAVRAGLTALPNAAAEAAGGLYTRGTGAGQINQPANGVVDTNTKTWNALTTVALPLVPTTAGRTLDVSAGGEAGLDWANVGSPTTTLALTGTTIATTQQVDVNTIKTQTVTAAAGVTFPTSIASPTNITAGTITTATNLTNAPTAGDFTATMKTSIGTAVAASAVASVTGNVGGNVTGSVGTVNALAANVITAAATATDFGTEVGTAVWATTARVLTANTNLNDLDAAGVRAAVGLASANLDTQLAAIDDFIDTEVAAIKAKTDQLVFTVANQVDVNVLDWKSATAPAMTGDAFARLGAPAGASVSADVAAVKVDTAAIKVSTDKLDDTVELTSDAVYVFTADALANAPTGGGSAPTAAAIADAVWNEAIADHSGVSGSTAEALNAAGSAGDPWVTALPGAYSAGQAGFIVGTNLDAVVSTRATQTSVNTVDDFLDTEIADIQNRLPAALVSGRIDASVGAMAANVMTAAAAAADLTTELQTGLATAAALTTVAGNVTSIKASTDNLPADPADASVVAGLIAAVSTKVDTVDTNVDAILLDTGTDGVVVAAAAKTGYRLSSAGVDDVLRTALTEGYAADGSTFTLEQALYMLWALLAERSIASTTLTAKKLDGSTSAMTFTLDDGTAPTAQTRAT